MHRIPAYIILFLMLALIQIFLLNNLMAGAFFCPLIYVAFIILLPLDTPPIVMLGCALAMGVTMDTTMGIAGLNTAATLPIAFFRPNILGLLSAHDEHRDDGIPSPKRMGVNLFWSYLVAMILIHHTLFFVMEALSWGHVGRTLLRILCSGATTTLLAWLTARLFTNKYSTRK